jgi:4-hydroxybenzoate polyprenyltransferase
LETVWSKKMKFTTVLGLVTVASMFALGGQPNLLLLPRSLEIICILLFIAGFGYFVAWPAFKNMRLAQSKQLYEGDTCPHCGQKIVTGDEANDEYNLQSPIGLS